MADVNPCVKCDKNTGGSCSLYLYCDAWKTQYLKRQQRIHAYAEQVLPAYYAKQEKEVAGDG